MSIVLLGGAGFIGSKLARRFLERGEQVLVIDNLCRGREEHIAALPGAERLTFARADASNVRDMLNITASFHSSAPVAEVWHMAANSDIPAGIADASVDLRDTFLTTHACLETMKALGLKRLAFASSSAVYGDHGASVVLREETGPLLPISNYGAMKLASEALISAAAESFLERAWLFRFPNVVGVPATHGVILDFLRKLKTAPGCLDVLGNGTQQKAYLHVDELIEAMLFIVQRSAGKLNLFNIGPEDDGCRVADIARAVTTRVAPGARIAFGEENRGWVGDVPRFRYNVEKLAALGWIPRLSSMDAVRRAVEEIARQEGM